LAFIIYFKKNITLSIVCRILLELFTQVNSHLLESAFIKNRMHMEELTMMLREQAIFSVQDVQYALLEIDGKLSVLPKTSEQVATKQGVKADISQAYLQTFWI